MGTLITIRIDALTQRNIDRIARERGTSRSAVVRQALQQLATPAAPTPNGSAYARMSDLVGCYRSGRGNLSKATGSGFRRILKEKRAR